MTTVITSVFGGAAIAGAIVWLFQSWISERLKNAIKHEYDEKLESHKAQLKASIDIDLETHKAKLQIENISATERLKADLQIASLEHQIRYSRLHDKVAVTVAGTYSRLFNLAVAVERYISPFESGTGPTKEQRRAAIPGAMKDFADYFRLRRLYLPKQLADEISEFEKKIVGLAHEFMWGVEQRGDDRHPDLDTWSKVDREFQKEARPLFQSLEDEFRKLLGVR